MFGGKIMDTFIDKLAQKLTAQEMIKANAAADAAELGRSKMQIAQYDDLIKEMRMISQINTESAEQLKTFLGQFLLKLEEANEAEKISQLIDESLLKIQEMQQASIDLTQVEEKLAELKVSMDPLFTELTDHVHKENVKVYRNVQAVVVEETAKTNETIATSIKALSGKLTAVFGIAIAALVVSAVGVVLQLLTSFHII